MDYVKKYYELAKKEREKREQGNGKENNKLLRSSIAILILRIYGNKFFLMVFLCKFKIGVIGLFIFIFSLDSFITSQIFVGKSP